MTTAPVLLTSAGDRPAGGAALGEVALASVIGLGLLTVLLGLVWAHRSRRTTALTAIGVRLGRATGTPAWVALPTVLATTSLLVALFGMMWDISFHIDVGRDPGPLANPAHYFILFGLFGVFSAGVLACALPLDTTPGPAALRFVRGWRVPVGGALLTAAGFYALLGFPLDDIWHRLFGQDVTLWGPTHLMLIGGAGLSLVGILVLDQEGSRTPVPDGAVPAGTRTHFFRRSAAMGGLLLGLSVYQGEYDFDVEQFRQVLDPLMIAGAAGLALVAARLFVGRGAALTAAVFFLVVRGVVSLLVGPVLGQTTPSFPLYLGSALLVEALALLLPLRRRPLAFGAVAGVLIGTVGFLTEVWWTSITRTLTWGSDIAVEGTLLSVAGGVAGGLLGALLATGLQRRLPRPAAARTVLVCALLVLVAAVADGLLATVPSGVRATFAIQDVTAAPRTGTVAVQLDPADAVDDPAWVQITSWQGGGLVVEPLQRTGPGAYRTTRPVPLDGDWKTMLRLADGRELTAVPIYLPADADIGKPEVPAVDGTTRAAGPEKLILQREQKDDVPRWLWNAAAVVVLLCTLAIIAAMSWGVGRYSRRATGGEVPAPSSPDRPTPVPSGRRG